MRWLGPWGSNGVRRDGEERLKVLHAFTVGYSAITLSRGWYEFLESRGVESHLMVSTHYGDRDDLESIAGLAKVHPIEMTRGFALHVDIRGVAQIRRLIKQIGPDLIHLNSPKASFLTSLALRTLPEPPPSLYMVRGYPGELLGSWKRPLAVRAENFTVGQATVALFVSQSLRKAMQHDGIDKQGVILGAGSSSGVDTEWFHPPPSPLEVRAVRNRLGIPPAAFVAGTVGRITREKGIRELQGAWSRLARPDWRLLIVGAPDEDFPPADTFMQWATSRPDVVMAGQVSDTRDYYWAMDLLLHPSHREGFPSAVLEAAACGRPTIGAAAVGTIDAIEGDGATGWFHDPGDSASLAQVLAALGEADIRSAGMRARQRVERHFDARDHRERLWEMYLRCLAGSA